MKKSVTALASVALLPGARLEPPKRLRAAEKTVWREVVAAKPADWFAADTAPLLEAYCQAVVAYRWIADQRIAFEAVLVGTEEDMKAYDRLTKIADRQARLMESIAVKMRLTQQSRYTPQAANTASKKAGAARPWERTA